MSGAVEAEGRARPLSGGLWTLFSWLRRDEHSSTESVSSAGSDRTVASFAFLAPALYGAAGGGLATRPPPSPPSDSYRRRVRERSLRRQRDRDLTLHRKYGLYGLGFDASSLPLPAAGARRPAERDRRATSECPRAHVPGKRRAPPPPVTAATLPRRRARKRPAPLPPSQARPTSQPPGLSSMQRLPALDEHPPRSRDDATDCKPEKYSKKDTQTKETKNTKIRREKSFLKHIFENKKRNSSIETGSVKLLPNISELDKQAAEMIEKYRLKEMAPTDVTEREIGKNESTSKRQTEAWICTRCLRKYDSSVITCNYCLPLNKSSDSYKYSKVYSSATQTKGNLNNITSVSTSANIEDKEKLKEILKEMKDSLPKRPKSELITSSKLKSTREIETKGDYPKVVEASTLRIGSTICVDKRPIPQASTSTVVTEPSTNQLISQNINKTNNNELTTINSVIITQPVVLVHTKESNVVTSESKDIKGNPAHFMLVKNDVTITSKDVPSTTTEKPDSAKEPKQAVNMHTKVLNFSNENKDPNDNSYANKNDAIKDTKDGLKFTVTKTEKSNCTNDLKPLKILSKTKYDLNTPLKISSLLNPMYVPKTTSTTNTEAKLVAQVDLKEIKKEKAITEPLQNTVKNENIAEKPSPQLIPSNPESNYDSKLTPETKYKHKQIDFNENTEIQKKDANSNDVKMKCNNNTALNKNAQFLTKDTKSNSIATKFSNNLALNEHAHVQSKDAKPNNIEVKNVQFPTENTKPNTIETKFSKNLVLNENAQIQSKDAKPNNIEVKSSNNLVNNTLSDEGLSTPTTSKEYRIDHHARRRDLIKQLERSIATGDEKAAAEAAVKLAQLKLSCSVLSFSSQIVAEASPSTSFTPQEISESKPNNDRKIDIKKLNEVTQKSSINNLRPAQDSHVKKTSENALKQKNDKHECNDEKKPLTAVKEVQVKEITKPNTSGFPEVESPKQAQAQDEPKNNVLVKSGPSEPSTSKSISSTKKENDDGDIPILIWVEDKEATRGPVQLHVRRDAVLGDLRRQAERSLGLAARLQRWIVGRALCADERATLASLAGPDLSAPFYLCLVESDTKTIQKVAAELNVKDDPGSVYTELVKLEKQPLVSNSEVFECGICIEECRPGSGVVLRECVHSFCKECLADVVRHSEEPAVGCPATGCRGVLQEREIRGLVSPEDYEKWLARGLAAAESGTRHAFHCRTKDCAGWALCEPGVQRFPCPVCKRTNCVPCEAIHDGFTCEQHRAKRESGANTAASQADEGTRALLESLISRGEALECPECSAIITKKWGCDWIKCSACKTEICWVTRGRRWGPAGRGDTSAGCRCGVDGKRCHPSCGYCH